MLKKNVSNLILLIILLSFFLGTLLTYSPNSRAQNWIEIPPYNTLWPLWSPVLSPLDDVTGLATPIISSLTPDTQLPVMPGLTWDPSLPYPWLLYNTLAGMVYFDPLAGINLWPAGSLIDDAGLPAPIPLPLGYESLPITDAFWLANNVPLGNYGFILSYPSFQPTITPWYPAAYIPSLAPPPPLLSSLLTPQDILGPILGVPSILTPPAPPTIPTQTFNALVIPVGTPITDIVIPPTAIISGAFIF